MKTTLLTSSTLLALPLLALANPNPVPQGASTAVFSSATSPVNITEITSSIVSSASSEASSILSAASSSFASLTSMGGSAASSVSMSISSALSEVSSSASSVAAQGTSSASSLASAAGGAAAPTAGPRPLVAGAVVGAAALGFALF